MTPEAKKQSEDYCRRAWALIDKYKNDELTEVLTHYLVSDGVTEVALDEWDKCVEQVKSERERCAKIADNWAKLETEGTIGWQVASELADLIRQGSEGE